MNAPQVLPRVADRTVRPRLPAVSSTVFKHLVLIVVGVAVDRWQSWSFPFYTTAAVYALGAAAWLAIDPLRPIEPQPHPALRAQQA